MEQLIYIWLKNLDSFCLSHCVDWEAWCPGFSIIIGILVGLAAILSGLYYYKYFGGGFIKNGYEL